MVRRTAWVVFAEAVGLVLGGLSYGISGAVGRPTDRLATGLAGALAVLVGAATGWLSRALRSARSWSRSPIVVLQLLALPVGAGLVQGHVYYAAAPVLLLALLTLGLLATPSARQELGGPEG